MLEHDVSGQKSPDTTVASLDYRVLYLACWSIAVGRHPRVTDVNDDYLFLLTEASSRLRTDHVHAMQTEGRV